jgi:hypothetical protein
MLIVMYSTTYYLVEIINFLIEIVIDKCKIVIDLCTIYPTHRVPNGYGYPPGMGMGKVLYPWVRVWVEVYTHWLYGYGYGIALPCPLPSLIGGSTADSGRMFRWENFLGIFLRSVAN